MVFPELDGGAIVAGNCETAGAFGCPCESATDCTSGLCLPTPDGPQCSAVCDDQCPDGWQCKPLDMTCVDCPLVCLPQHLYLCRPCKTNQECTSPYSDGGEQCSQLGVGGDFCTTACQSNQDCPVDHQCLTQTSVTGQSSNQCVPFDNQCNCSALSISESASTSCETTNSIGSCKGTRECTTAGLTNCSAPWAQLETCDGVDNDCDGLPDNNACSGNQICSCTNGICACACPPNIPDCVENPTCSPGATTPCNASCGDGLKQCINGEWGPCEGPEPIACVDYNTCNMIESCATQCPDPPTELCSGLDEDCDGQADEGFECVAGSTQSDACPGSCGTRTRTCSNTCSWGAWSSCGGGECVPGTTTEEQVSCGACGTQTQVTTCNGNCQWDAPTLVGSCTNAGECQPGQTQECSNCTEQVCTNSCTWTDCQLKAGMECDHISASGIAGGNWQCCGTGMWQFCSPSCEWYSCANCAGAPNHCENNCP